MNFQFDKMHKTWLHQLNGKTVANIYNVDYNHDRHKDTYLPWLFFITFINFEYFLEIEGDIDGIHLKISLTEKQKLAQRLAENNFPNEADLWKVYETTSAETLGKLLDKKIDCIESEEETYVTFIRFITKNVYITIFEGSATGLEVSDQHDAQLHYEDTFTIFNTK
jgi:hypothetical protein